MSEAAPVALFVYNRPEHTAETLAALRDNDLAGQTALYVFSDGPKTQTQAEAVAQVRRIVRDVQGFAALEIVERETNLGLADSIIGGVSQVLVRYGRVIVLEDDLVTSRYFLRYMNEALEKYADDDRVASIHGYLYPTRQTFAAPFFLVDTGSWGWATWQRAWTCFEPDGQKLLKELRLRNLTDKFDMDGAFPFTRLLEEQTLGLNDSWAIRWQATAFLQNRLTLYPPRSLVRNTGLDGSGVHCDATGYFDVGVSVTPVVLGDIPVAESRIALKAFQRYFRRLQGPLPVRVLRRLRNLLLGCR